MIYLRKNVRTAWLCALGATFLLAVVVGMAAADVVDMYHIVYGFYAYPDEPLERSEFNVLPYEMGGGILWYGTSFRAGKDDGGGWALWARYSLVGEEITQGDIIYGYFKLYVDDLEDPPTGSKEDVVFKIGNVTQEKWVSISLVWPEDAYGQCHLKVKTTGGSSFTSTNAYNWAGWHLVEYNMLVDNAQNGGTIQLKIDGADNGSISNIDVRQGYDWNHVSHGVFSTHYKALDFCFKELHLCNNASLWQ